MPGHTTPHHELDTAEPTQRPATGPHHQHEHHLHERQQNDRHHDHHLRGPISVPGRPPGRHATTSDAASGRPAGRTR
jgi:hypothetical protein